MAEKLFLQLALHAAILEGVFSLAGNGRMLGLVDTRDLARLIGLGSARLPELLWALRAAEASRAVSQDPNGAWRVLLPQQQSHELALLLRGARLYAERIHVDSDTVQVVISKPAEPSQLIAALESTLEGTWGMSTTAELLGEMAAKARRRFSIMTPFVDRDGARRIVELFEATATEVRRELIVRDGLPADLVTHSRDLQRLGVHTFDFRLPRPERFESETFHAKAVHVDDSECYVGSSNMTKWPFGYSLELGFHVRGSSGRRVSMVVDAVLAVSTPIAIGS